MSRVIMKDEPNYSIREIKEIIGLGQRGESNEEQDLDKILGLVLPYVWYTSLNEASFKDLMRRVFKREVDSLMKN